MSQLLHDLSWVLPLRNELLTPIMQGFTWLGYDRFILLFLPLGYWAWNKPLFLRLFILVAITALLNAFLKDLWQDPRPDIGLRMDHEVGESFGAPSGHAQIAVVLWLWLACESRRLWSWLGCSLIVLGIIFSRLYLGAHDLEDVLLGAALGGVTLLLFALVRHRAWWREANLAWHLLLVVGVAVAAQLGWPGTAPHYVPLLAGMLVGVLSGYRLEVRTLDFQVPARVWRRALVALLGCAAFLLFQALLKRLETALGLEPLLWQSLRGVLMGWFIALLMPWLLVRGRLLLAGRAPA
jgi:glycerophosphoryl diester phosphodiesterase